MSSNRKRKDQKDSSNQEKHKKRFVWPERLHQDFISSVFDLGLRSATSSSVIDLLRSKLALDDGDEALDPEQVDGQIHKLTLHRQRVRELRATADEMDEANGERDKKSELDNLLKVQSDRRLKILMTQAAIRHQSELLERSIQVLGSLQGELEASNKQQRTLAEVLRSHIENFSDKAVPAPSTSPESPICGSSSSSDLASGLANGAAHTPALAATRDVSGAGSSVERGHLANGDSRSRHQGMPPPMPPLGLTPVAPSAPPEPPPGPPPSQPLARVPPTAPVHPSVAAPSPPPTQTANRQPMEQEMRAYMDMHRTMQSQMDQQYLQFAPATSLEETESAPFDTTGDWMDDILEDQLFEFLKD